MKRGILVLILIVCSLIIGILNTVMKLSIDYETFPKSILVIGIIITILLLLFWLWMLIDVLRSDNEEKVFWIVIILIFNFIGALFYFFQVKKETSKRK